MKWSHEESNFLVYTKSGGPIVWKLWYSSRNESALEFAGRESLKFKPNSVLGIPKPRTRPVNRKKNKVTIKACFG